VTPPPATSSASKRRSQEESMVVKPSSGLQKKIASAQPLKRQRKAAAVAAVSLEVHKPSSSSDHVSVTFCTRPCYFLNSGVLTYTACAQQPLMQRFIYLGTNCVKIQETTDASKGFFVVSFTSDYFCFTYLYSCFSQLLISSPLLKSP
jgi:hypothetical protein